MDGHIDSDVMIPDTNMIIKGNGETQLAGMSQLKIHIFFSDLIP